VSVYFDDTHDTADAGAQLDARLRDIRKHLEEQSIDAEVIEAIETAIRAKHPPVGRSGRGVITAGSRIVLDQHLSVPPVSTIIRVSDLPYILPVVEHGIPHTSYVLTSPCTTAAGPAHRPSKDRAIRCTRRTKPTPPATEVRKAASRRRSARTSGRLPTTSHG
jgi:hypothetical protein